MEKDIALLAVGIVVGVMNAIAGGGMLIGFPVMIALGIHPIVANATTGLIVSPGNLASAFGYRKYLKQVPLRYAWLLLPIVIGGAVGSLTLRNTPPGHFADLVPVLLLFGIGLFIVQPFIHFHLHRHMKKRSKSYWPLIILCLAMLPLSFYGGYFGAGFGFIMMAFLGFTNLPDTHMMNALKNVSAVFLSITSLVCLYSSHLIDWQTGAIMAVGTITGGYLGARYAQRFPSHILRIVVIVIGLAAVVYLGTKS